MLVFIDISGVFDFDMGKHLADFAVIIAEPESKNYCQDTYWNIYGVEGDDV